jgi:hypothetical protein
MTTFAHTETGRALDPWPNDTPAHYLARFPGVDTSAWAVTQVEDGTTQGATPDGQGGWANAAAPITPVPQPNNANNPYWPKKILETKDFYALVGQVLGARYPRLRKDDAFLWVYDSLNKIDLVNTDDHAGQFLEMLAYLEKTNAADAQPLMSAQDVAVIMASWPPATITG